MSYINYLKCCDGFGDVCVDYFVHLQLEGAEVKENNFLSKKTEALLGKKAKHKQNTKKYSHMDKKSPKG